MQKTILIIFSFLFALSFFPYSIFKSSAWGQTADKKVISPGSGVGRFRIGGTMPDERTLRALVREEGIEIIPSGNIIKKMRVTSSGYPVLRSQIRARQSTLGDVIRFYGKGDSMLQGSLIILRFPTQGIEFEVEESEDRVSAITVFRPIPTEIHPVQIQKLYKYKEQFKRRE